MQAPQRAKDRLDPVPSIAKRILFLSIDGLTDPLGQSQILPYLTRLAAPDLHITIVSLEKPTASLADTQAVQAELACRNMTWVPLRYANRPPVLAAVANLLRMRGEALRLHRADRFHIVHCRSDLPALVGRTMQRRGARFLFDMRGFWADERAAGGAWPPEHPVYGPIYRFFKRKEHEWLLAADHVVCLTQAAMREMLTWPGVTDHASQISVIPCCVDLELFDPRKVSNEDRIRARAQLGLTGGEPILTFLGSVGPLTQIDTMLAFFEAWANRNPGGRFLLITPTKPDGIWDAVRRRSIPEDRVRVISAPRRDVPIFLSLSTLGVFFVRPAFFRLAMSPTKQAEFMAMGVPVACSAGVGDTDEIMNDAKMGIAVDTTESRAFEPTVEALRTIVFDPGAIRAAAEARFRLEDGVRAYRAIYDALGDLERMG